MVEARRVLVLLVGVGLMGLPEGSALMLPGQANTVAQPSGREPARQEPAQTVAPSVQVAPSASVTPSAPVTSSAPAANDGKGADDVKAAERPLPDIAALMHDVETNQRAAEAIEKDYLYRSLVTEQQLDLK